MAPSSDSPDARSKSITTADLDTHGVLNRHSANHPALRIGVSEDKGPRRSMEDAHSFVVDFDAIRGQGFFAVFDGHAGKHAAEWCGSHFHERLLDTLRADPTLTIPDVLNNTFHVVDECLSQLSEQSDGKMHSGCTAVTAFLRIEDVDGQQSFTHVPLTPPDSPGPSDREVPPTSSPVDGSQDGKSDSDSRSANGHKKSKSSSSTSRFRKALRSIGGGSSKRTPPASPSTPIGSTNIIIPPATSRRVLYCANAGDARGVLCRAGRAVRLTYDHKGTDKQEAKRITDAGGFVMSGRVNGVLAVTRSLGDSSMKEFVVGAPYTTETELCEEDEFLILACDGLWDVISDQAAVELIRDVEDAQACSEKLLKYALRNHTSDNITVLVVRFKN